MKKWGMALLCALSLALPAAAQEQGAQWGFTIPVTIRDTRIGGCRIWAAPYREGGEPADPGFEDAPFALEVPVERYGAVQEVFLPGGTPPSADATYKIWIQPVPKPAYLGLNLPGTATAVYQYYCVQQLQLPEVLYVPQGKELVLTAAALPAYTTAPITWAVNDPQGNITAVEQPQQGNTSSMSVTGNAAGGEATVTASAGSESAACTVKVIHSSEQVKAGDGERPLTYPDTVGGYSWYIVDVDEEMGYYTLLCKSELFSGVNFGGSSDWFTSTARSSFHGIYQKMSAEEKAHVVPVNCDGEAGYTPSAGAVGSLQDYVWLPTAAQVAGCPSQIPIANQSYSSYAAAGHTVGERAYRERLLWFTGKTTQAQMKEVYGNSKLNSWLRSPFTSSKATLTCINALGMLSYRDYDKARTDMSVRPAMVWRP